MSLPAGPWATLLDFLAQRFPTVTQAEWLRRMAGGELMDEAAQPISGNRPYPAGGRMYYWRTLPSETQISFEERVLFQDEQLVVADKPHFLPVTPVGRYVQQSLLVRLKRRLALDTLTPSTALTARPPAWCCLPCSRAAATPTAPCFVNGWWARRMRRLPRGRSQARCLRAFTKAAWWKAVSFFACARHPAAPIARPASSYWKRVLNWPLPAHATDRQAAPVAGS